jgi:hypothetical protein
LKKINNTESNLKKGIVMKILKYTLSLTIIFCCLYSNAEALDSCVPSISQDKVKFISDRLYVLDKNCQYEPFELKGFNYGGVTMGMFPASPAAGGTPGVINEICYYDLTLAQNVCTGQNVFDFSEHYIFDRDFPAIAASGANTIRTYGVVTPKLLEKAAKSGLMVVAGYWVNDRDWTFAGSPTARMQMIQDFVNYVNALRADPNYGQVLMINLGNEMDRALCQYGSNCYGTSLTQQANGWYQFVNDALLAAKAGHASSRPMTINNGKAAQMDIGDSSISADDSSLTALDAWALDIYSPNFRDSGTNISFFTTYANNSSKPLFIYEYGSDLYDNQNLQMNELAQSVFVLNNYSLIKSEYDNPSSKVAGGLVFNWTDGGWSPNEEFLNPTGLWVSDPKGDFFGCVGGLCDGEMFGVNGLAVSPHPSPKNFESEKLVPRQVLEDLTAIWTQ